MCSEIHNVYCFLSHVLSNLFLIRQSGEGCIVDLWNKISINYEQILERVCGPSYCEPTKRKGGPWWALKKKTWMAIAQNRLPFGFHIHIIDLWIFYTVFTTPPQRLYLHFWSTFQFTLHKHKRLTGLMKFHFRAAFCLLCHDVCEFSFTDIISPTSGPHNFRLQNRQHLLNIF